MTAPRLVVDLETIEANARAMVERLGARGIQVTAVTKAVLGCPEVAGALLRGGVAGLGDSRVANLARLREAAVAAPRTMIRTPMLSEAAAVVELADVSMNTEAVVLDALDDAARSLGTRHGVIVMVELGDLREGVPVESVVPLALTVTERAGLSLEGIGTNLACQSGVAPDQEKMALLSQLADDVETATGAPLRIVSGGNSANLTWALSAPDVGRVNDLRLGESLLLGTEPLRRRPIDGLRTDAFTLRAEVIEVQTKPTQPWGTIAQGAFGRPAVRRGAGTTHQAIVALGRQDVDPEGLTAPAGITVLGMSSDHLVLDLGQCTVAVGDEIAFHLNYSALVRAATSPFVATTHRSPHGHASLDSRGALHPPTIRSVTGSTGHGRIEASMSDPHPPDDQADDEIAGATVVSIVEADLDGDGVTDAVEVTTITGIDVDDDGEPDVVEVTTTTAIDVDGDGVPDLVTSRTVTAVDVDGDGVADAVAVVEAVGIDANGDGVISEDEIEVTETLLVPDEDAD